MFISYCQPTWYDLTTCKAAFIPSDNYYALIFHHDSCMVAPLFAEKGIEMRDKMVGIVR